MEKMRKEDMLKLAINKLRCEVGSADSILSYMQETVSDKKPAFGYKGDDIAVKVSVLSNQGKGESACIKDFILINYAYGDEFFVSFEQYKDLVKVHRSECFIGRPGSRYHMTGECADDSLIVSVMIKKDLFFREFLSVIYSDYDLFHFFLNPQISSFTDKYVLIPDSNSKIIRRILEIMILEHADRNEDSQKVLKDTVRVLFFEILRRYKEIKISNIPDSIPDQLLAFIKDHADLVTLKEMAVHFSYNPKYMSALFLKQTGRRYSEVVLENRMERSLLLLRNTNLSIDEITEILRFRDQSTFYKAFHKYYGFTPGEYRKRCKSDSRSLS